MGWWLKWSFAGNQDRHTVHGAIVVDHKYVEPCGEPCHPGVGLIITVESRLSIGVVAAFLTRSSTRSVDNSAGVSET